MDRSSFTMKLKKGFEAEYKFRHDNIWPELLDLLTGDGITEYYIFLDEKTGILFAFMKRETSNAKLLIKEHPVMKKWWNYMKDIMDTNPDGSPMTTGLTEVFALNPTEK